MSWGKTIGVSSIFSDEIGVSSIFGDELVPVQFVRKKNTDTNCSPVHSVDGT
jgi:hypothetical protein